MDKESSTTGKSKPWLQKSALNIVVAILVVGGGGYLIASGNWHRMVAALRNMIRERPEQTEVQPTIRNPITIELVEGTVDTIRFSSDDSSIPPTVEAKPASAGVPLQLLGSLLLDPDALVRVHSRFPGEVVRIGMVDSKGNEVLDSEPKSGDGTGNGIEKSNGDKPDKDVSKNKLKPEKQPDDRAKADKLIKQIAHKVESKPESSPIDSDIHGLRLRDHVHKGQLLAVVWSKEIGEKKSELVDSISRLNLSQRILERLMKLKPGTVPGQTIQEKQREFEGDFIDMQRAERTLRSWRITEEEIAAMHREAERLHQHQKRVGEQILDSQTEKGIEGGNEKLAELRKMKLKIDPVLERQWAQIEIRSPLDGEILERNFTVGQIVDANDDLFKIGDTRRLRVSSFIYEEDMPFIRSLAPDQRIWRIDLKSDPNDKPITTEFDVIGIMIDPQMHTGAIMGPFDNPDGRFAPGQFVTSTIDRAPDPNLVVVPTSAVIETGDASAVFVRAADGGRVFTRRRINAVRRGRLFTYISSNSEGLAAGVAPLKAGEVLVTSGVLELSVELDNLKSSARSVQATKDAEGR